MAHLLKTPEFHSEEEEASWWDSNEDALDQAFSKAAESGTLGQGTLAKRAKTPTTTIRLDPVDIAMAKEQAAKRGLKYQTYLKMIIHQALRKAS